MSGAPGRIRTSYPLVRSQVLYPDELRTLIAALQRGEIITTNLASSKLFGGEGIYRGIKGGIKGAVKGASTGAVTGAFAGGIGAIPGAAKGAVIGGISEGGLEAALGAGGYTIEKGICVYNEKKPEMEKMWKNFKKDVSETIDKGYKETRKFLGSTKKTAEKSKQNIASFKKDTGKMLNKGYEDFKKFFKIKPKETEKNKKVQKEYVR